VENVLGIRFAAEGKANLAVSVVLNSALQVAVALIPILVLISFAIGFTPFTLVIPPILAVALFLSILEVTVVTVDGRARRGRWSGAGRALRHYCNYLLVGMNQTCILSDGCSADLRVQGLSTL
jgi:calcium/proton exchanger cax